MSRLPVQAVITVDAKLVRQGLQDLNAELPRIGRAGIYKTLVDIRKELQIETDIPPGEYPWKSENQRKHVLALIRTGRLKRPYVRTHKYAHSYVIIATKEGWVLTNKVAYARYVGGTLVNRQAKLHRNRWIRFSIAVQKGIDKLPENIKSELRVTKK